MNQEELLEGALEEIKTLRGFLGEAYRQHNHDDLIGGTLLSSANLFAKALEEAVFTLLLHFKSKGKNE